MIFASTASPVRIETNRERLIASVVAVTNVARLANSRVLSACTRAEHSIPSWMARTLMAPAATQRRRPVTVSTSNECDRDVDIAARRTGIRAYLIGAVHQCLCGFAVDARQADLEPCGEAIGAVRGSDVHLGVDGRVGWESQLLSAGHEPDRAQEARRPTGGEQLLRVGAASGGAGRRKLDRQAAVITVGSAVAATRSVGLRGVEHFVEGHGRLLSTSAVGCPWEARPMQGDASAQNVLGRRSAPRDSPQYLPRNRHPHGFFPEPPLCSGCVTSLDFFN